jgi:hypothetical protein
MLVSSLEPEPSEPESEPEPHLIAAPAQQKGCGSLRLRLQNTGSVTPDSMLTLLI